jgi:putative oxidoreductase
MNAALMIGGRILLVSIFLVSGWNKAINRPRTAEYIASKGLPLPDILTTLTIALEIVAPLLVIFAAVTIALGIGGTFHVIVERFAVVAALALAAFCVATAFIFHNFWAFDPAQVQNQFNHFMKNIAIAGAFLTIAAAPSTNSA